MSFDTYLKELEKIERQRPKSECAMTEPLLQSLNKYKAISYSEFPTLLKIVRELHGAVESIKEEGNHPCADSLDQILSEADGALEKVNAIVEEEGK